MKKLFANNPVLIAASTAGLLYAIALIIASAVAKTDAPALFHFYFSGAFAVAVATALTVHVVKSGKRGVALYMALGMGCLAIGKIFVIAAVLASYWTDPISVGFIAEVCCYLFIMAALYAVSAPPRGVIAALNTVALFAAAACTAAVIVNNGILLIIAITAFNLLCAGLAFAVMLRSKKKRFFAAAIALTCVFGILSAFDIPYLIADAFSPLLGILTVFATVGCKEESLHA